MELLYFGFLNSRIAGGQTPGKRPPGIEVVDNEASQRSPPRSGGRFVILARPFYRTGYPFRDTRAGAWFRVPPGMVLVLVVFGGMVSMLYLIACNRRTAPFLHGLEPGTLVSKPESFLFWDEGFGIHQHPAQRGCVKRPPSY